MSQGVNDRKITGMMIYYYFVCKKKLWYFVHQINMEQDNKNVQIGKILDETSYAREEKHIEIDGAINIDFIKENNILHEVKKSRKIEEASVWQVKYYLYYLKKKGIEGLRGKIDYPLLKKSVEVELNDEDMQSIEEVIIDINKIICEEKSRMAIKKGICKKCAYFDLCFV